MPFKAWIAIGALLAGLAVAAGAIGAHALKGRLDDAQLASYETAVRYQFFHALAILLVGLLMAQFPDGGWRLAGGLFIAGCVLFSGGIYLWLLSGFTPFAKYLVPIGGMSWIVGWMALAGLAWRRL